MFGLRFPVSVIGHEERLGLEIAADSAERWFNYHQEADERNIQLVVELEAVKEHRDALAKAYQEAFEGALEAIAAGLTVAAAALVAEAERDEALAVAEQTLANLLESEAAACELGVQLMTLAGAADDFLSLPAGPQRKVAKTHLAAVLDEIDGEGDEDDE